MYQAISIAALLLSSIALIIGCMALSILVGLKNSTHQIEYLDPYSDKIIKDTEKALNEEYTEEDNI